MGVWLRDKDNGWVHQSKFQTTEYVTKTNH